MEATMALVAAFHSKKNPGKYHICSKCTEGNNIERENKAPGTGRGILCKTCSRLRRENKC